jgi:hypothetical protein
VQEQIKQSHSIHNETDRTHSCDVTGITRGAVSLESGCIRYTPPSRYYGSDYFTYLVCDTVKSLVVIEQ